MILAAGLGTRLRPLTDRLPKALIPVAGVPLLERVARRLIAAGVDRIIVNVHHHSEQIVRYLEERDSFGVQVRVSPEEVEPLDTGGALRRAAPLFEENDPFLLHNVDVLSDLDLRALYASHLREARGPNGAPGRADADAGPAGGATRPVNGGAEGAAAPGPLLATLAVQERETRRPLLADEVGVFGVANLATGWRREAREPVGEVRELGFCGIHVVAAEVRRRLTEEGAFSIWDPYFRLVAEGWRLLPYEIGEARWLEVGTPERLERARALLAGGPRGE